MLLDSAALEHLLCFLEVINFQKPLMSAEHESADVPHQLIAEASMVLLA